MNEEMDMRSLIPNGMYNYTFSFSKQAFKESSDFCDCSKPH